MSDSDNSSVKLIDEESVADGKAAMDESATSGSKPSKKTVEEMYQKLDQLEHILKRPDTYGESSTDLVEPLKTKPLLVL